MLYYFIHEPTGGVNFNVINVGSTAAAIWNYEDWKSRMYQEKRLISINLRSGTPARRQVTVVGNCVYRGKGWEHNV